MTLTLRQNGDKRIAVKMVKKSQCNISLRFFLFHKMIMSYKKSNFVCKFND